jgi:eukaryotic translation initiation factor 2C
MSTTSSHGAIVNSHLSLKINSKLKGVSHTISGSVDIKTGRHRGVSGAKTNTMIIGADVTHPKEGQQHICPSMAGVVATDQDNSSCYLGSARLQKGKEEVSIPERCLDPL